VLFADGQFFQVNGRLKDKTKREEKKREEKRRKEKKSKKEKIQVIALYSRMFSSYLQFHSSFHFCDNKPRRKKMLQKFNYNNVGLGHLLKFSIILSSNSFTAVL